jgi:hypothetical protein
MASGEYYGFPGGFVTFWEDFVRDNVTDLVETAGGSGAQDIADVHGGWWRQTLGGDDNDDMLIAAEVVWEVDEGSALVFETRVQSSVITVQGLWAGMSDANTEGSGVNSIHAESGTLTTAATDAFGFILDESAAGTQDTIWQAVGVQNGTDNTSLSLTPSANIVATTPQILRMEANTLSSGTVRYYVGTAEQMGGGELISTRTSWYRSSIQYCPILGADDRGTAANPEWDYLFVSAPRT